MEDSQLKKYFEMMIAMSYDCLNGGITLKTYIANTKAVLEILEKEAVR